MTRDPSSFEALDHALREAVHEGMVDYRGLGRSAHLEKAIAALGEAPEPAAGAARIAFYCNAYNALVLRGVLDGHDATTWLSRKRFFSLARWTVAGRSLTLDDIEHRILRKAGEPRIHFAINCASASCPALRNTIWRPATLDRDLDEAARAFVNDPSRNRFDAATHSATISEIFKWFEKDFAPNVPTFLAAFVSDRAVARGLAAGGYRIAHLDYDWRLNGAP